MSGKESLEDLKKAASREPSDALYESIVIHLDELLDRQLIALIESFWEVQVELETEMILGESV
jgi:hypothetical protein